MKISLKQTEKQSLNTALEALRGALKKFQRNRNENQSLYSERDELVTAIQAMEKNLKRRDAAAASDLAAKRELLAGVERQIAAVERADAAALEGKGPKADEELREVVTATIAVTDGILKRELNGLIDRIAKKYAPFYRTPVAARYAASQSDMVALFGQHVVLHKFLPPDATCLPLASRLASLIENNLLKENSGWQWVNGEVI